jgi:RNA polymerase sigma-70 factor, ECF subfamily
LPGPAANLLIAPSSHPGCLRYSRPVEHVLSPGDARLLQGLRSRDESTFAELVREYNASLLRVAEVYVPSRAVAEEVVQEAWIGVLNGIDRFEARSSLKTWIFRILTNIAKTRGQREGRTVPFSSLERPEAVPEPAVDADRFLPADHERWPGHWSARPEPWPQERLLAAETRAVLERAIEELPPAQRAVISLRDLEGWSSGEACNALGVSETNQRVLLHRARSKVRQVLEDYLSEAR